MFLDRYWLTIPQVELLEMQVQERLEKTRNRGKSGGGSILDQWKLLFGPLYVDRTRVGMLMGAFQRELSFKSAPLLCLTLSRRYRMVWNQCSTVLWAHPGSCPWRTG